MTRSRTHGIWVQPGAIALLAALSFPLQANAVASCTGNCAKVTVSAPSAAAGRTAVASVRFDQGTTDGQAGGPDEIAAIAFSMNLSGDDSVPLTLHDCTLNADGLPASVKPAQALSNFRVVVENASCTGKTHCLCPDGGSGLTQDNFMNVVVYGPNPLPTPGPGPIDIPVLPSGVLFTVDLDVASGTAAGSTIPLHVINQVDDAERPAFRAFLSVGDKNAVDQTCRPEASTPPCGGANPTSQVAVVQGSIAIGAGCTGDCNASGDVTVDEIITMVNIALGTGTVSGCPAADGNSDGQVTVDEIVAAVNKALNGCAS